jgi:glycine/D-amino acid oxidase-like deaminating enzyme
VTARDVVLATNGYSGPLSPWHRRRVIPIGSYIIATEPRPVNEMKKLIPHDRMVSDTRRVVFYYRLSPDQRSILFGGRVAYMETNPLVSAPRLHKYLSAIFPSMRDAHVTHSWMGFVAYTFDTLPHVGKQDGIHYAMGYCGSGVSLATYFGMRVGQQVLGRAEGKTALDNVPFQTRPLAPATRGSWLERVIECPAAGQAADLAAPSTLQHLSSRASSELRAAGPA